jgi:hypothetical protein
MACLYRIVANGVFLCFLYRSNNNNNDNDDDNDDDDDDNNNNNTNNTRLSDNET